MINNNTKNKIKLVFLTLYIYALHNPTYAQRDLVIDNKGTIKQFNRTTVTTADTAPSNPFIKDLWFDTSTYITKVWNGTSWDEIIKLPDIGDVKYGMQSTDHDGWVTLNGRAVNTLSASQKAEAMSLGFTTNLPDAIDRTLMKRSMGSIGDVGGNNTIQIQQQNLPNVTFTGSTTDDGNHSHTIQDRHSTGTSPRGRGGRAVLRDRLNTTRTTSNNGNHSHTGTVSTGGSGVIIDFTPSFLNVNVFVYLGN